MQAFTFMSDIARRLTGMSESELQEYEPTTPLSRRDIQPIDTLKIRNVRLAAGLVAFPADLEPVRKYLKEHYPKAFKIKSN